MLVLSLDTCILLWGLHTTELMNHAPSFAQITQLEFGAIIGLDDLDCLAILIRNHTNKICNLGRHLKLAFQHNNPSVSSTVINYGQKNL